MTGADPVLITDDEALLGDVLRLAAAAGVGLEVHRRPDPGLGGWTTAPAVLIGADQAAPLASLHPPRRGEVHLVSLGAAGDGLFRAAVDVGAGSVLELPAADDWLVELLTDVGDGVGRPSVTIGVVGGSGGVGASVLAAAVALTAARSGAAMLVDLDPWGAGLSRVAGFDEPPGLTWTELAGSHGRLGARALRDALAGSSGLGILGWSDVPAVSPPTALVREVVRAGQRGHDWVVLDIPRGADAASGLLGRCDHVLLVVRAALGGVAAASRVADRLRREAPGTALVVRSRRGSAPASDVARAVGLPLVATVRDQRRLEEHLDLGLGPVHQKRSPLARTAARLVEQWQPER